MLGAQWVLQPGDSFIHSYFFPLCFLFSFSGFLSRWILGLLLRMLDLIFCLYIFSPFSFFLPHIRSFNFFLPTPSFIYVDYHLVMYTFKILWLPHFCNLFFLYAVSFFFFQGTDCLYFYFLNWAFTSYVILMFSFFYWLNLASLHIDNFHQRSW